MRPAKLWRSMPTDSATAAATAFWTDENAALEQAEAIALIARQIKFRPRSVQALPIDKRAKYLAGLAAGVRPAGRAPAGGLSPRVPAADDGRVPRRPRHRARRRADRGRHARRRPTPEALTPAADTLAAAYPKADVGRYFWTLLWQDPDTWGALAGSARTATSEADAAVRAPRLRLRQPARGRPSRAAAAIRRAKTPCTKRSSRPSPTAACSARVRANKSGLPRPVRARARPWWSIPRRCLVRRTSRPADVAEIVDRHLVGGEPVARLRLADGCINTGACAHKPRRPRRRLDRTHRPWMRSSPATT